MMNQPEPTRIRYETSDLNLATYLRCRSFTIEDITRQHGKAVFTFRDSPAIRSAILEYANDGLIQVRSFCNTLRDLKALVR
ncbi:MAG TPA: DUF5659 domain-containing protein [Blastocatellia bacterium]|nr:DUF5659 domain-containing protein [Blastocatellia bacterium]